MQERNNKSVTRPFQPDQSEDFKPISVRSPVDHPILFRVRCLFDLQLATIVRFLRPALTAIDGTILDVGAGESPWRSWLNEDVRYVGLDVDSSHVFGMSIRVPDVRYYSGAEMPFTNQEFDAVMCIEVLEHAVDPELLISEISRVLRTGGTLILTVPWSARRHHVPHDFHRFTKERLVKLFSEYNFQVVEMRERGSDVSVIANKILILNIRLIRIRAEWSYPLRFLLGLTIIPLTLIFLLAAHISIWRNLGSKMDPLGYFVLARRS